MYGIADKVTALFFDRAVISFGSYVENRIDDATREAKDRSQAQAQADLELRKIMEPNKTRGTKMAL